VSEKKIKVYGWLYLFVCIALMFESKINATESLNTAPAPDISQPTLYPALSSLKSLSPQQHYLNLPPARYSSFDLPGLQSVTKCKINYRHQISSSRLVLSTIGLLTLNYSAYQHFKDIWWNYPTSGFHIYRGWRRDQGWYDLGPHDSLWFHMDKLGHYTNSRLLSLFLSDIASWVGYQKSTAQWIGAVTSWLLFLEIELYDGHYEEWGFSIGDLLANSAGAFMPLISQKVSWIEKFTLKLSYRPSNLESESYIVEDYAGMTFWLSANPRVVLPPAIENLWPSFLNLALGYGITDKTYGEIELFFALDYDLTVIHTRYYWIKRLLYYLNFLHLPAPAVRFSPAKAYHLLYF